MPHPNQTPILIGVGANLPTAGFKSPRETCGAALHQLQQRGDVAITGCSNWYESAPVPVSDQPWFVNAVASITTGLTPGMLMTKLLDIETEFGRQRSVKNAPRILDLDLLAYHDLILTGDPIVPHPRMHERAFVVLPICDLDPNWTHPESSVTAQDLCSQLKLTQDIRPLPPADGYLGTEWHLPDSP